MRSRLRTRAIRLAVFGLLALHAGLFVQRIRDFSITEPLVLVRWFAAAVVAGAGLLLLRRRVSRRAWGVFWTVVLLLHAAAPAQAVHGDLVLEAVFVLAPLLLAVVGLAPANISSPSSFLADSGQAFRLSPSRAPLASRAPPSR